MIRMEISEEMKKIKKNPNASYEEKRKYIRYAINVLKKEPEQLLEELSYWPLAEVDKAIRDVEREKQKPKPKRYYVSLKEPMEDIHLK